MTARDIAVLSQRHPIRAGIEQLVGHRLDDRSTRVRSLSDVFEGAPETPSLVVVDVLKLFSSEVTLLPRFTGAAPNMLVVGLLADSDRLVAAWNEDIPAVPLEDLSAEIITRMSGSPNAASEFYHFRGRHCAERVHSFLARSFERQALTERETEVVELLRLGWHYARIGNYLGLEVQTVKNHASRIYGKLGVSTRYELSARSIVPTFTLPKLPNRPAHA